MTNENSNRFYSIAAGAAEPNKKGSAATHFALKNTIHFVSEIQCRKGSGTAPHSCRVYDVRG